jgi:hypothetical protein
MCREIEYEQLGKGEWPQEVFAFFMAALRDRSVSAMEGSASLITSIYDDFDKLTAAQQEALLMELDDCADGFGDEILRHSASDLIARLYPVPVARDMFNRWLRIATPNRLHMAQVGLEVLVLANRLMPEEEIGVRRQLAELWRRERR